MRSGRRSASGRTDGREVELLVVLAQRVKLELLADPDDPATAITGPDGKPLTFWFRGGSTLIVDPEAATITYSVAKNITSDRRRARHMAFLRDQVAQQGTAAIARFGLTDTMHERQRKLEPFALAHIEAPTIRGPTDMAKKTTTERRRRRPV